MQFVCCCKQLLEASVIQKIKNLAHNVNIKCGLRKRQTQNKPKLTIINSIKEPDHK